MQITKQLRPQLKPEPNWNKLGFGAVFTDHMFVMDYVEGQGWHDARIVPYAEISLSPAATALHYGVEVFEGMKAYYGGEGRTLLFRPEANAKRINNSSARLCIPHLPEEYFMEAIKELVRLEQRWVPKLPNTSLYIRPFIIATEERLSSSNVSKEYKFMVIVSPVGAYYPEGLDPVKIYVERHYSRSGPGGTGDAKCGGNYAASAIAQCKAKELGYSQVLWLDGGEHKYIDEVGAMNVIFKIAGEVVTPELTGGILPGITRDSVLQLVRDKGLKTVERRITLAEVCEAAKNGTLEEAFGTGTAAVIAPIGELCVDGEKLVINNNQIGSLTQWVYDTLTGIQFGKLEDKHNWSMDIS